MTTAHRATFAPAKGGTSRGESDLGKLSKQYSSRDMPSHTKLKYRQTGQNAPEEVSRRDLRRELEERERSSRSEKRSEGRSRESLKRPKIESSSSAAAMDADDPVDSDDSDDDSSDDDAEELMAELNRIKKERQDEAAKAEMERKEEEERIRTENILSGNPLINAARTGPGAAPAAPTGNFAVKRRWDDDVVFKNCARGQSDKPKQVFINDTLRSEFHKKFMEKYVK